jgi:uncharacterized protein YfaS (alpha-2-macroglobulin family)
MVSNDTNAVKLLLSLVNKKKWKEDIGRFVRGTLSRQRKGSWDLTTANAWGTLAMEKFSKEYEKDPVTGETEMSVSDNSKTQNWTKSPKGGENLFPWKSGKNDLVVKHNGTGKPWIIVQSKAAVPIKESIRNGYSIEKEVISIQSKNSSSYSRGDILRIKLKIKADADMTWVVINDPIPSGATILSGGLKASSATASEKQTGGVSPTFEERAFDAYRVYYEYAPNGEWTIEYTVRLNQDGKFQLPQTRIEAMYSPDMYGETPNKIYEIRKD